MFNRRGFEFTKKTLGATRVAHPDRREHPALSFEALQSPIIDDETWLSEVCTPQPTTKAIDTLGNTQCGTMCEDDATTSMSTDCLYGDLSSSDDDETSWDSLYLVGGTRAPSTTMSIVVS
eukprot:577942-Amphidinium_carterae.1